MPLDGTEFFDDPALAKLWQVERLLASEDQWCKGALRDRKGRHCLVGAIAVADGRRELTKPILVAAREVGGRHYWRIQSFNDDPVTTHRDILQVIDRARAILVSDLARARQPGWQQKFKATIAGLFSLDGEYGPPSDRAAAAESPTLAIGSGLEPSADAGEKLRQPADLCL